MAHLQKIFIILKIEKRLVKMEGFVTFQDGIMKTICHVYKHEDGRILHLLPVVHIGEKKYYKALLDYIGDNICVFEQIKLGIEGKKINNPESHKLPKSLDEWIDLNESTAKEMDKDYGREVKKFLKKIKIREIRQLRRVVKRNLERVDNRIARIFYQCERTAFSLSNLPIIQITLSSLMDLAYQMNEIDYVNDIPKRNNWIHADFDIKIPVDFDFKKMLASPNSEIINSSKSHARVLYGTLYLIETFMFKNLNERRNEFAKLLAPQFQTENTLIQTVPHLIEPRNNIIIEKADSLFDTHDEVVIFYGAGHMQGIREAAVKADFQLMSTIEFEVYRLVEENPE